MVTPAVAALEALEDVHLAEDAHLVTVAPAVEGRIAPLLRKMSRIFLVNWADKKTRENWNQIKKDLNQTEDDGHHIPRPPSSL